ncbi:MAG TPA: tetratricopeptide repeat protein [Planctomycetaceae bacterium]|jgi:tetratricopeptide (TPR) repeat protein|nr:tetratricopeptide repeat protein [Planctomycetaceae bacterium]
MARHTAHTIRPAATHPNFGAPGRRTTSSPALGRPLSISLRSIAFAILIPLTTGCGWLPLVSRHSAEESTRLTEEARLASERGEQRQARELLSRAAAVAPDDPEIQRALARGLLRAGETEQAVKHLRYMMRRSVDDPDAYLDLARILYEERRYDECQELVDSALRLVPTHTEAQLLKGRLAEVKNKDDEALEVYYRLLAGDPTATEATLRVSDLLVRTGQPSQAAPLLRGIVDSDRVTPAEQARAHWVLGQIYAKDRRWADAAEQLAAVGELRTDLSADDCYQIAYAAWQAGLREQAEQSVARALSLDPRHANALALAATFRQGETTASQTAYSGSSLLAPAPKGWEQSPREQVTPQ